MSIKASFLVWDEDGGETVDDACTIEARDAEGAAESYAEEDVDGQTDNIYGNGRKIGTRDDAGVVRFYEVTAEWSPTFYSIKVD
jgi:hypothetical protein